MSGPVLPWDILKLIILNYCKPRDALRMSMTCWRLYKLWSPTERKWLVCDRKPEILKDIEWERIDRQMVGLKDIIDYHFCLICYSIRKSTSSHKKRKGHAFESSKSVVCILCRGVSHGINDECFMIPQKCHKCSHKGPAGARRAIQTGITHTRRNGTIFAPVYLFCPKCATEDREMKMKWL